MPAGDDTSEALGLGDRGFTVDEKGKFNQERFAEALAELDVDEDAGDDQVELDLRRPRVRGDCAGGERPCPFVTCRHHMAVEVLDTGSLRIVSHLDLETLPQTCSLDVADAGEHTLEQVGVLLNLTRERVRQLERKGLKSAHAFARLYGIREDAVPFVPDHRTTARSVPGRTTE